MLLTSPLHLQRPARVRDRRRGLRLARARDQPHRAHRALRPLPHRHLLIRPGGFPPSRQGAQPSRSRRSRARVLERRRGGPRAGRRAGPRPRAATAKRHRLAAGLRQRAPDRERAARLLPRRLLAAPAPAPPPRERGGELRRRGGRPARTGRARRGRSGSRRTRRRRAGRSARRGCRPRRPTSSPRTPAPRRCRRRSAWRAGHVPVRDDAVDEEECGRAHRHGHDAQHERLDLRGHVQAVERGGDEPGRGPHRQADEDGAQHERAPRSPRPTATGGGAGRRAR